MTLHLSACGFNLRGGETALTSHPMIIVETDGKAISPFIAQQLKNQLQQSGEAGAEKVTVSFTDAKFKKRVIVLDNNAHPAEQMLILQLNYVLSANGREPRNESLNAEMNYFFNSQSLISADQYEIELQTRLVHQAVSSIRAKLQFFLHKF